MGKRAVCFTAGPLLILLGGFPMLFVYAWASMVPQDLQGWDRWSAILGRMFDFSDGGLLSIAAASAVFLGVILILIGIASFASKSPNSTAPVP